MRLSEIRRVGFDTETTSADPLTARIVTAALVLTGGGPLTQTFTWLINPGVDIPTEASDIHGITTEMAQADGQDPKVALDDLANKIRWVLQHDIPLIAFNAAFDWTVLECDLARNGLPTMAERLLGDSPVGLLDPFVIDKSVDKYRKGSRKLKNTCEYYGVELTDWHTADADAMAAVLVMDQIADKYPQLGDMAPEDLFAQQRLWAKAIAAGLQAYLRSDRAGEKRDPDVVINGDWPLRTVAES